ncbi:MAG: nicotinamidase [bacterium]|nr:MAG: nicotinamidase [bacterium]
MQTNKALLVVDIQNDFCPGGALGVREGDQIIATVNKYVDLFQKNQFPVFVSRDWHPEDSKHFKESGGPWPPHCVRNTKGAEFHPDFLVPDEAIILSKGTDPEMDGYSVFEAHDSINKPFIDLLKEMGIDELYIAGIATDYCVRMTSLDAFKNSYKVNVLTDAIKGVDEQDSKHAIDEIVAKNGKLKIFSEVLKEL